MKEVVIAGAVRTPIGQIRGTLSQVRPDDLAAVAIREVVARAELDAAEIEEVFMGCANQAGEDNRNVARMALLLAGLPIDVPGATARQQTEFVDVTGYGKMGAEYFSFGAGTDITELLHHSRFEICAPGVVQWLNTRDPSSKAGRRNIFLSRL